MEKKGASKVTFWALPAILFAGWVIHFFWIIGLSNSLIPILLLLILITLSFNTLKKQKWELSDLRWLIAPLLLIFLTIILPWWKYNTSQHTDAYYHLLEARNFAGFVDWAPSHQGLDFLFRPPLIPGAYAIELSLNGLTWVTFTPLILTIATLWQLQHLSELWNTKSNSCLVIPAFLILPSVRYWGQLQLLDVPVSGMFILVIHLLIISNKNIDSKRDAQILGSCVGLMFLTKYVFIYSVGLCFWIILIDHNNLQRFKWFAKGWFFITLPFLIYHTIQYGNPFEALTPQSTFAIDGISQTLGTYNSEEWWIDYQMEITIIGILGTINGLFLLFHRNKSELYSVLVFLIPYIVIHAIILDYGTVRYQIPVFALTIVLIMVSLPNINEKLNFDSKYINKTFNTFGIAALIILSSIHISTINEENERYSTLVPKMNSIMEFYLSSSDMFPEEESVLTSKYIPIALHTGKQTSRYLFTDNSLTDSLIEKDLNYALTSNYFPLRTWELDFKPFFGNELVEPIDYYANENGISILWKKGNESWSNFPDNITTNGSLYGNMLKLEKSQSINFEQNKVIYWIAQTNNTNIEYIIETYLEKQSENINQSCDFEKTSEFCQYNSGELVNDSERNLYVWIL